MNSEERYGGCKSPEVIAGTECLPNTSNRCTWCGRHMPRPRYQSGVERQQWRLYLESQGRGGTDPVEWEAGGRDYWESDPGDEEK